MGIFSLHREEFEIEKVTPLATEESILRLKEEIEENGYGFTKKSGIFLNFDEMEKQDEQ
mgnify:CR=1 FL=1